MDKNLGLVRFPYAQGWRTELSGAKKDILIKKKNEHKIQEPVERQIYETIYCRKQEKNWYKTFRLYC